MTGVEWDKTKVSEQPPRCTARAKELWSPPIAKREKSKYIILLRCHRSSTEQQEEEEEEEEECARRLKLLTDRNARVFAKLWLEIEERARRAQSDDAGLTSPPRACVFATFSC